MQRSHSKHRGSDHELSLSCLVVMSGPHLVGVTMNVITVIACVNIITHTYNVYVHPR